MTARAARRRAEREASKAAAARHSSAAQVEADRLAREDEERRQAEVRRHQERSQTLTPAEQRTEAARFVAEELARPQRFRRELLAGFRRPAVTPTQGDPAFLERAVVAMLREELGPAATELDEAALAAAARRALEEAGLGPTPAPSDGAKLPSEEQMAAQEAVRQFLKPQETGTRRRSLRAG